MIGALKIFFYRLSPALYGKMKGAFYSLFHARSNVATTAQLKPRKNVFIDASAEIQDYVIIHAHEGAVKIGKHSQINPFTVIYGGIGVEIGDDVMVAPHCVIVSGNHNHSDTSQPMRHAGCIYKGPKVVIENDVWIGANCTILDGVRVRRGAIIAANSVVNSDVGEFKIFGGVPAREIGDRKGHRS